MHISFRLLPGQLPGQPSHQFSTLIIDFDEKEKNNSLASITSRILAKVGYEVDSESCDFKILHGGSSIDIEGTSIADYLNLLRHGTPATFMITPRPEAMQENRWHALSLIEFTPIPLSLIKMILSYSAGRPYLEAYRVCPHDEAVLKANLSILLKVLRGALTGLGFEQHEQRLTATELLAQLPRRDRRRILDKKRRINRASSTTNYGDKQKRGQ